jgi:hypothetical protein
MLFREYLFVPSSLGATNRCSLKSGSARIFALQAQAEKFSVSPFTKGDDLRRFLKAAIAAETRQSEAGTIQ